MYEINGDSLLLCPETARWLDRADIGIDGSGRNTYEPNRSFELGWGPMSPAQFNQLCNLFTAVSLTGTADVVLPDRCADMWTGLHYECHLDEPTSEGYWNQFHMNVKMMLRDIRT